MSDNYKIMNNQQSISELLLSFGLNPTGARIYLHLLNRQPRTILELSRELNLPRTSIYDNIYKLIDKGLLEKNIFYKSQKLQASPVELLQTIVDQEKDRVQKLQSDLDFLKTAVTKTFSGSLNTNVRYYHGRQGYMQMMWNSLSADGETIGYSVLGRIEVVGEKFMTKWFQENINRKIKDRVIINPKKDSLKHLNTNGQKSFRDKFQKTRMLDEKTLYISGDTNIYNDIFALCFWKQGEIIGVEIENSELVKTQKSIFEILWKLAKPV